MLYTLTLTREQLTLLATVLARQPWGEVVGLMDAIRALAAQEVEEKANAIDPAFEHDASTSVN